MRPTFRTAAAVAVAAVVALAGCSSGSSDTSGSSSSAGSSTSAKPFKVVAFTSGNQTPVGGWWVKAVQAKATELGWDLTMIQGDFDFQKMNPQVESAIGQGADAVFDGYTDYAAISSITTAAKDAGIPIFAIDAGTEETDAFKLNITTNQQGIVDQTVGAIQQVKSPATGRTEALNLVADYLTAHPGGLDAIWVGWDDAALGAAQAVKEAGATVPVTGVDAVSESIAAIQDGQMLATIDQPWPTINDSVIAAMVEFQKSGTLPTQAFDTVNTTLVTKANAADITPSDKLGN